MVVRDLFRECVGRLKAAHIESATLDARLIIEHVLHKKELFVVKYPQAEVSKEDAIRIYEKTAMRCQHKPLAYLIGVREFMGLEFWVNEQVLIPRPDSELLVETVLEECKKNPHKKEILDIGTGSGALAISVAYYAENVFVQGIDISPGAIEVAQKNAQKNDVEHAVSFFVCDILKEDPKKIYDIVLSNPPYIRPAVIQTLESDVKDYEPMSALCGGEDGLNFYRAIAKRAKTWLKRPGFLALEIGYDQAEDVQNLLKAEGFSAVTCYHDLADNPRVVIGRVS